MLLALLTLPSDERSRVACSCKAIIMPTMSPQAILERYPGFFADVAEIYAARPNLLSRLKHCSESRQFYQEWLGT
jgi:hypothetical protein